jgi:hypothetical protein
MDFVFVQQINFFTKDQKFNSNFKFWQVFKTNFPAESNHELFGIYVQEEILVIGFLDGIVKNLECDNSNENVRF